MASHDEYPLPGSPCINAQSPPTLQREIELFPRHVTSKALPHDVLRLVFADLKDLTPKDRVTCARGARVCQAWHEPALEVLWRTTHMGPERLCPLYLVLRPLGSRWHHPPRSTDEQAQYLDDIIKEAPTVSEHRWDRFLRYASRVRVIGGWRPTALELQVVRTLLARNGGATFLPSVTVVSYNKPSAEPPEAFEVLCALLAPTLRELVYYVPSGPELSAARIQNALAQIANSVPHLVSLDVRPAVSYAGGILPNVRPPHYVAALEDCEGSSLITQLSQFSALQNLDISIRSAVTPANMKMFAFLPSLRSLECSINGFADTKHCFEMPCLRTVWIRGPTPSLTGFVACLRAPLLHALGMSAKPPISLDTVTQLVRAISGSSAAGYLRHLCFNVEFEAHYPYADYPVTPLLDVVRPLLSATELESFTMWVSPGWKMSLSDSDLLTIAQAWPLIQELCLGLRNKSATIPSLAVLPLLSRCCPKLRLLDLPVDISELPELPAGMQHVIPTSPSRGGASSKPVASRHGHSLLGIRLDVRRWLRTDVPPAALGRFLHALYPALDVHDCGSICNGADGALMRQDWDKMLSEMSALQKAQEVSVRL